MSHYYRHENRHDSAPRAHSPKRNPFQSSRMSRGMPGNPAYSSHGDYSPTKVRAHLNHKQPSNHGNHDSDQRLLEMLSSTVACLKQKNMDLEALGCLEQSLWLKRRMFGADNSVVHKALNEVMLSYNSVAMQYLAQGQFDQCLAMLRKAEAITAPGNFKRCQALQILTFNNIGCCYRKLGKLKSALKYLKEAAQIGSGSAHVKNLSITHLNLCAIQSQLGRHDLALEHAQAAIFHTQEELVSLEDGTSDERSEDDSDRDQDALDPKTREEKIISLAVAYHNLAVELEFNGRGEASLQWYKKALQLVWKYRETNEALCESFKKIFLDAKKKQQTANVRQNGIPASAYNSVGGRRPITRPQSAHASSRSRCGTDEGDVSYSSTVASHCYKATKPSTAGQRYETSRNGSGKSQRPVSASTRQRPVSAKPSTRANYRSTHQGSRDSVDCTFELHWKKLEEEHDLNDFQTRQTAGVKPELKVRGRPQSAGGATAVARRRRQTPFVGQRQQKLQGQLYFAAQDEDFIGNDEDYGVIADDGDSDDGFDNYHGTTTSSNQLEREGNGAGGTKAHGGGRPVNSRRQLPVGSRHRRVLDDSRSQASLDQSEIIIDSDAEIASSRPELSSPSMSLTGYNGDDDTDPDLPAQRVCHMEYLRRMKKLAENIKDDLNGVGIQPPIVISAETNQSRSPLFQKEGHDPANDECSSRVSTPRSATSKLRDRIEQARRDSPRNLQDVEENNSKPDEVLSATPTKNKQSSGVDDGVELQEDAHVFESEAAARDAELQLFRVAAGSRLQAFFRGQRCRTQVKQMKQVKLEIASVRVIQRQVRQYLVVLREQGRLEEERLQLELQKEEVEDMAACLIQRLCRRALSRKATSGESKDEEEVETPSPVPQRRPFSIADVVLGAAVNKLAGSSPKLPNQDLPEPPQLNTAATVPRLNLSRLSEPETPQRSSTMSSIPLSDRDGAGASFSEQPKSTRRSDVYDDDEEWEGHLPRSEDSTARTDHSNKEGSETTAPRSVVATPRTNRSASEGQQTTQQRSAASTPKTNRSITEEADEQQTHVAAVRIQAFFKGYSVRCCLAQYNAGTLSRKYIEQKHFNVALDLAFAQEIDFLEELSAIKIQALVRGRQSRLLTECLKAGAHTAAWTIQRSFRLHRQSTREAVNAGVRSIAARTIQQVFRDYEARRAAIHQAAVNDELVSVQQIAATTIQNFWKQFFTVHDHCIEEIEAATCIQALGRGHLARKSMKSLNSSSSGISKQSSAFSMSSSAEKLTEEEESKTASSRQSLSINYSFLPPSICELYLSSGGNQLQSINSQINAQEIAELGLTFIDFLGELETCSDETVCSSALDTMRILVETSPESIKHLATVVKVAQTLDRRLQQGFWSEAIEASSIALLHAFRDVLDAQ